MSATDVGRAPPQGKLLAGIRTGDDAGHRNRRTGVEDGVAAADDGNRDTRAQAALRDGQLRIDHPVVLVNQRQGELAFTPGELAITPCTKRTRCTPGSQCTPCTCLLYTSPSP